MGRLLAVRAVGPEFVRVLLDAWERGDAVLPIHPALPPAAADALTTALRAGDDVDPGDALVVATSGTTGDPKGVVLTHDAVRAAAEITSTRLGVDPDRDRWLACLPLAHVGGLSVVTRAILTKTPLTVHERFDPDAVAGAADEGCTRVSLVATALARIDPARFRTVLLGGGPAPDAVADNVVVTYGLTETGGGVVYDGRPLDGVDVRIADNGQILLRGPTSLRAYRDGSDPKDADGWLSTDDIGRLDADGRLHVHGRTTDLIITGGENVWPVAVEAVMRRHPGVADVAVVGHADPEWGQRVVAYVEPRPGVSPLPLATMRSWAKEHLPAYAVPSAVVWMDALPRTPLGKVARSALRAPR